jgi:hypothetical protein
MLTALLSYSSLIVAVSLNIAANGLQVLFTGSIFRCFNGAQFLFVLGNVPMKNSGENPSTALAADNRFKVWKIYCCIRFMPSSGLLLSPNQLVIEVKDNFVKNNLVTALIIVAAFPIRKLCLSIVHGTNFRRLDISF